MTRCLPALLLASLAVHSSSAQGLPPEVVLLARIKHHVREAVQRLPDYTCLETSQRLRRTGPNKEMRPVDILRLEVLYTGKQELYAPPGGGDFRENNPFDFTSFGLTANGLFATFLKTLFVNDNGMFTWRGEETNEPGREALAAVGRRVVRYDYRVPALTSGWSMQVDTASGIVAMKGSIWADADSLELLRLKVEADDIPPNLDAAEVVLILDYARTRIGGADVMLPQTGDLILVHKSGAASRNILEYTHCRSFQTQSTLSFEAPVLAAAGPVIRQTPVVTLPAGLTVGIRLTTPITQSETLGTQIEGTVDGNVVDKGSLLVPSGARVVGRIRRLDRNPDTGSFTAGIEFTEIRSEASVFRFYADLQSAASSSTVEVIRDGPLEARLPGVGFLSMRGPSFTLPAGFRFTWKTRPLGR